MGTYGYIVLYPDGIATIAEPESTARLVIQAFESAGLMRRGLSRLAQPDGECSATFENQRDEGKLPDNAHFAIDPSDLLPSIRALVYALPEEGSELELPYADITVMANAAPLIDAMSGEEVARTVAAVEFSYEDARLSEEVHRVRDPEHPVFAELSRVFGAPIRNVILAG